MHWRVGLNLYNVEKQFSGRKKQIKAHLWAKMYPLPPLPSTTLSPYRSILIASEVMFFFTEVHYLSPLPALFPGVGNWYLTNVDVNFC